VGARALSAVDAFIRANTRLGRHPLVPEVSLHLASAITPIWTASEDSLASSGVEPPFWAFAWPGGAATARFILDHPDRVRGRAVLDLAAGSGIAAIAAAIAGAGAVTAADIDPTARAAIALNARANGVELAIAAGDLLARAAPSAGLILAGDVCYARAMAERVIDWLRAAHRAGAEVWLADPGRTYRPTTGLAEMARIEVPTSLELEDRALRETVLYPLTG
jgi:predicted nicotinamide N-methyase